MRFNVSFNNLFKSKLSESEVFPKYLPWASKNKSDLEMQQNEGIPEWQGCPLLLGSVMSHQWICSVFHNLCCNKASLIMRRVSHSAGARGCQQSVVLVCLESFNPGINVMHKWYFWTKKWQHEEHQQIVILYIAIKGAEEHVTGMVAVAYRNGIIPYCWLSPCNRLLANFLFGTFKWHLS